MRRVVARVGLPATVVGITAVLIIAASSLILAVGYRNQLGDLRHTIYTRCQQREAYDRASQDTRGALRGWFATNAGQEATNPFIDRRLRRQRVAADQHVVQKLDHVLRVGAPTGCQQYR
jgi:hypothetical protein